MLKRQIVYSKQTAYSENTAILYMFLLKTFQQVKKKKPISKWQYHEPQIHNEN